MFGKRLIIFPVLLCIIAAAVAVHNNTLTLPAVLSPLVKAPQKVVSIVQNTLPQTNPDDLYNALNTIKPSITNEKVCEIAKKLPPNLEGVTQKNLKDLCPDCTTAALATANKYAPLETNLKTLQESSDAATIIANKDLTHLCIVEHNPVLVLFYASFEATGSGQKSPTKKTTTNTTAPTSFTEDQLWQALVDYRHAHKKNRSYP